MTSIALESDRYALGQLDFPVEPVDGNHLSLMIAIIAPLSATFWGTVGWFGYRLSTILFS